MTVPNVFEFHRIAQRAVRRAFRQSPFERVDGWLKHWEDHFEGERWRVWYDGSQRIGNPTEWSWEDLDAYDQFEGNWLAAAGGVVTRARALLHLGRERAGDADVGLTFFPESFDDWLYERGFEFDQRVAIGRVLYCIKAACCLLIGRTRPSRLGLDGYRETVSEMAVWDIRSSGYDYEESGTTLEVGRGLFRNWWFDIGSL